ncbi:MAG: EpsG family protein [Clostridia bacterium]|nr:EpsG family protein [Clostridia bacterium]
MSGVDVNFYLRLAWIYTIICWGLALYSRYHPLPKLGGIGQPLPNPVSLIVPILLYVPFSGLRSDSGDTFYYIKDFTEMMPDGKVDFHIGEETLYPMLADIVKETVDDYKVLIMITAIIALVPVLVVLYKYSHPYDLAIYLFMATGYFGLSMNGIRQYCATGIVLLGTKYLFSEKKSAIIKYSIFVLIAWAMHGSAWIMFFVFWFSRRKAWKPSSFLLLFMSLVGLSLFDLILPSFLSALEETSFDNYATQGWFTSGEEGGSSFIRVLVSMVPVIIAYFSRARMRQLGFVGDVLTNIGFVNAALYIISTYNWIFARLAIYINVYYIILLAWVVYNGVQKKDRGLYYAVCVMFYYYYSTLQNYALSNYISEVYFPGRKFFNFG